MSTDVAVDRFGGRRPAGVVHGVRFAPPPTTTLCGQANGLHLFSSLRFSDVDDGSCLACAKLAAMPDGQMSLPGV